MQIQSIAQKIGLSNRETSCFLLLLRGYTYDEVGNKLFINNKTVATHIQSAKIKLGCNTRAELFNIAYQFGLFDVASKMQTKH